MRERSELLEPKARLLLCLRTIFSLLGFRGSLTYPAAKRLVVAYFEMAWRIWKWRNFEMLGVIFGAVFFWRVKKVLFLKLRLSRILPAKHNI